MYAAAGPSLICPEGQGSCAATTFLLLKRGWKSGRHIDACGGLDGALGRRRTESHITDAVTLFQGVEQMRASQAGSGTYYYSEYDWEDDLYVL